MDGIEELFIYGSWAARYYGTVGPAPQDVDVLFIGSVSRDEVYEASVRSERRLRRDVNVTIRTAPQWLAADDGFSRQVKDSPRLQLRIASQRTRTMRDRRNTDRQRSHPSTALAQT